MLSFISGVNYIINDIIDIDKDKIHPEKRNRPLPSGNISKNKAIIYAVFLFVLSVFVSFKLNLLFGMSVLAIFLIAQTYSVYLKNIVFADVITISVNFVLRALSGAYIISVKASSWLILCTFLLALFLALCKRKGDLEELGDNASKHRSVFKYYTPELLMTAITVTSSILILSYAMYCFLRTNSLMMVTIPIATFLIFRYLYLLDSHNPIVKNPEGVFFDKQMVIGMGMWIITTLLILYM
jgi:4-hydroxybenzoate polyprenyltransferase